MFNFDFIKNAVASAKVEAKVGLYDAEVKGWGAIGDGARAVAAYADKRKAEAEERREAFCAEVDKIFGITDDPEEVVEQPEEVVEQPKEVKKSPLQQAEEILKKGLQDNPHATECWQAFGRACQLYPEAAYAVILNNEHVGDNGIDGVYLEGSNLGITFYECGAPCEREYSLKTGECVRDYNAERDWDCDWED